MPPLPRGTCIACARDVAMRNSGVAREHRHYKTGRKCPGSSMRSRQRIDEKADATNPERRVAAAPPVVLLRPPSEPVPPHV